MTRTMTLARYGKTRPTPHSVQTDGADDAGGQAVDVLRRIDEGAGAVAAVALLRRIRLRRIHGGRLAGSGDSLGCGLAGDGRLARLLGGRGDPRIPCYRALSTQFMNRRMG